LDEQELKETRRSQK